VDTDHFLKQNEVDDDAKANGLDLIQAKLLNSIGVSYSGDTRLKKFSTTYKSDFDSFCSSEWDLPTAKTGSDMPGNLSTASNGWDIWHEEESRRRTGYCIWVSCCGKFGEPTNKRPCRC
jgi:hypothetical protein